MAELTKQAIVRTFMQLLRRKPFNKITVTDIVKRCAIHRNTFYYYYTDIYALMDELFEMKVKKLVDMYREYNTWQEGFSAASQFAIENKKEIEHIYNSMDHARLERLLYDAIRKNMTYFIQGQAHGIEAKTGDLEKLSAFYTAALTGLAMRWMQDGMHQDPRPFIERLGILLDGQIRNALIRVNENKALGKKKSDTDMK